MSISEPEPEIIGPSVLNEPIADTEAAEPTLFLIQQALFERWAQIRDDVAHPLYDLYVRFIAMADGVRTAQDRLAADLHQDVTMLDPTLAKKFAHLLQSMMLHKATELLLEQGQVAVEHRESFFQAIRSDAAHTVVRPVQQGQPWTSQPQPALDAPTSHPVKTQVRDGAIAAVSTRRAIR